MDFHQFGKFPLVLVLAASVLVGVSTISHSILVVLYNPSEITVMAWINPDPLSGGDKGILFKDNVIFFELTESGTSWGISFTLRVAGQPLEHNRSGYSIPSGQWTHVAGTFNGTVLKLYINGTQIPGSATREGTIDSNLGRNYTIGYSYWKDEDRYFNGTIDEVAIFNRSLSADEILQLYSRGLEGNGYYETEAHARASGVIHYWKLDETNTRTFEDSISNSDATCSGREQPTSTTGMVDGALDFDGSDDKIYARAPIPYEPILFSNVVFAVAGLVMLFLRGLRGSLIVGALYFVVVLALVEEVLLNSALAWYGLALAFSGFVLLPLVGIVLASKERRVRVRARVKVVGDSSVASEKISFGHSRRTLAKKLQSLRRPVEGARVVFEVCGLLFATRIVFSPFPVSFLESAAFLPAIYTLIMGGVVAYLWFRGIPLGKVGFSRGLVNPRFQLLAGVGVGAVLGLVEFFILRPKPIGVGSNVVSNFFYLVVVMMVFVGLTEELLFRGLFQSYMVDLMPKWQAVHLSSLIFALFHIGWLNPMEVLFAYSAGIVFGYLFIKMGGLTAPVVAHGFGNIVLYMIAQLV